MSIIVTHVSMQEMAEDLARLSADFAHLRDQGQPTEAMLRDAPILQCWGAAQGPAPCLIGSVIGHPILGDRRIIHTSEVYALDPDEGWARTWSRFYRLGTHRGELAGGGND